MLNQNAMHVVVGEKRKSVNSRYLKKIKSRN